MVQDLPHPLQKIFDRAPFIKHLGIKLKDCGPGWCETFLTVRPEHFQQDNFIHAGVLATLADHTAGAAAGTLLGKEEICLTVEFKINLLRPAQGTTLRAKAKVLKGGKRLTVAESEVYAEDSNSPRLVAKAMVTLANIPKNTGTPGGQ